MEQEKSSPRQYHQHMYECFGDESNITWDCYDLSKNMKQLESKIGYALYGPPDHLPFDLLDQKPTQVNITEPGEKYSTHHTGYDKEKVEVIQDLCKRIVLENKCSLDPNELHIAILYALCVTEANGDLPEGSIQLRTDINALPFPVIRVRKCIGSNFGIGEDGHNKCFTFVDHECRVYKSWSSYLKENRLPKGILVVPKDGIYNSKNNEVLLQEIKSPASKILRKIVDYTDSAGAVAGIASTVVLGASAIPALTIAAPVLAGAVVATAVTSVYSLIRSSVNLADRGEHKQTISMANKEARGDWFGIATSTLGLAAGGSTKLLGAATARGMSIGKHAKNFVNVMNVTALVANGTSIGNSVCVCVDRLVNKKEYPTKLEIFQLTTSILFFGHSIYTFKTASDIITERQNSVIDQYKKDLSSNRQRKMFTKMEKETIRTAKDVTTGKRDIIRCLKNVENTNDFIAKSLRMNKQLNASKAKISFSPDGTALINNAEKINPVKFSTESRSYQTSFFENLPPPPPSSAVTKVQLKMTENRIINTFKTFNEKSGAFPINILQLFQNNDNYWEGISSCICKFTDKAQEIIIEVLLKLLSKAESFLIERLKSVFSDPSDIVMFFLSALFSFIKKRAEKYVILLGSKLKEAEETVIKTYLSKNDNFETICKATFKDLNKQLQTVENQNINTTTNSGTQKQLQLAESRVTNFFEKSLFSEETAAVPTKFVASIYKDLDAVSQTVGTFIYELTDQAQNIFLKFLWELLFSAENFLTKNWEPLPIPPDFHMRFFESLFCFIKKITKDDPKKEFESFLITILRKDAYFENISEMILKDLNDQLMSWIQKKRRMESVRGKTKCKICSGYYYKE